MLIKISVLIIIFLFMRVNCAAQEQEYHILNAGQFCDNNFTSDYTFRNIFKTSKDSLYKSFEKKKKAESKITWYQMFTNLPSDYRNLFKDIIDKKNLPNLFFLSALTGSLMTVDQAGWKYQRSLFNKVKFDRKISGLTIGIGNGKYQFITAALFASAGVVFHDETTLKTGSNIVEAILSTGLLVQVLKRITGRESPAASTESGGDWALMPSIKQYQKNQPKYYSFPSGHLSTATAVLTVIANNYPNEKWIKPVGYPLLAILGFSLVNKGMHWYSDLPLAYFLGFTFGNIVAPVKSSIPSNSSSEDKPKLTIFPSVGLNDLNFNILYNF